MNLYIRYFQNEILVKSVEEACVFLSSIPDIKVDDALANDLRRFLADPAMYPKRYKVKGKSYFIVIKTPFETIKEFQDEGAAKREGRELRQAERRDRIDHITRLRVGWYEACLTFKRVVSHPTTQKFMYCDTPFRARLKATSVQDCYNRIVDHLRARRDVDPRSQFPSVKGRNFEYTFLGMEG
ncbi:MAG: hypothetical protein IJT48_07625 [Bacteroidaceae bacterium]|nr:hypothetical protein [Bacteroidaceae bacterium]